MIRTDKFKALRKESNIDNGISTYLLSTEGVIDKSMVADGGKSPS